MQEVSLHLTTVVHRSLRHLLADDETIKRVPIDKIQNPVYRGYLSDPFVWKENRIYYAFGGAAPNEWCDVLETNGPRAFPVLQSLDLMHWVPQKRALKILDPAYGCNYWAPEIAFIEGTFYMYYSLGFGDKGHHLRVATSLRAQGPYTDSGALLTDPYHCPFAIDPSPFQDDDGSWYLFYARDFIDLNDGSRIGTGIVVDRLITPTKLAGDPAVILRARHDWQRFANDRIIYGAVYDWHTLEGPCVRKRNNRYWCLYSAGRWEDNTYGIDYAFADHVLGPYVTGDNSQGPRVLHTVPGKLIGPGHNSLVWGPDDMTEYIVYHAWDARMSKRQMRISPIEWTSHGPNLLQLP